VRVLFNPLLRKLQRLRLFICQLAGYLPTGASVLGLGCGNEVLPSMLAESTMMTPRI